jgi:hypothetical protein
VHGIVSTEQKNISVGVRYVKLQIISIKMRSM